MRHLLLIALDPSILSMLFLGLAIVWMLLDEKDRTRPLLVVAMVLNMFYGYLLNFVMGKENGLVPWKYDYVLARLDGALGISAAAIASSLQGAARWPLEIVYLLMVPMMVVWFLVARRNGLTRPLTLAYITVLLLGLTLYAMLPACGPLYAFGKAVAAPARGCADRHPHGRESECLSLLASGYSADFRAAFHRAGKPNILSFLFHCHCSGHDLDRRALRHRSRGRRGLRMPGG